MKHRLKWLSVLATTALTIPQAYADTGYIKSAVNMRMQPSIHSPIIKVLPKGLAINVNQCLPYWCEAKYGPWSGWVSRDYIAYYSQNYKPPQAIQNGGFFIGFTTGGDQSRFFEDFGQDPYNYIEPPHPPHPHWHHHRRPAPPRPIPPEPPHPIPPHRRHPNPYNGEFDPADAPSTSPNATPY